MYHVADEASNNDCNLNFLKLERKTMGALPEQDNWLLQSVPDEDWLSDEFL
jgi:hypothetical protein